jgi:hypothetical protein
MAGRDAVMANIAASAKSALSEGGRSILVEAEPGLGRSAVLDASALLAKTHGALVLRANAAAGGLGAFGLAQRLAEQLVAETPEVAQAVARAEGIDDVLFDGADVPKVRDLRSSGKGRYALETALGRWLLGISRERPLAIAVDDVQRADEPSLALLAALATELDTHRVLLLTTAATNAQPTDRLAFDVSCDTAPVCCSSGCRAWKQSSSSSPSSATCRT